MWGFKLIFLIAVVNGAKLPDYLKTCKRKDPNLSECLKTNVQDAIVKLANGAPEIGLKPLDPLDISMLVIGAGSGPVDVRQEFRNVKLHGISSSKLLKYGADLDHFTLYTETLSPELRLDAEYELNGKILLLPVKGKGPCVITLINAWLNHTLVGELYNRKGKQYMRIVDYKVSIVPEKMTFKFDNLFNGDQRLGNEINKVLNENWESLYNDVKAGYDESFALIFKDLANRVFNKVPFNEIFVE